ncbi:MAG TPA: DUF3558 family protein [Mycobacteriales bacterium]|nr:DUF3558 family protein [Mycobacteriales bacterium]
MRRWVVLIGFAALLLGTAACGSTPGQPTPATTADGGSTSAAPSSTTSSFSADKPCSLFSSSDLQQLGVSSPPSQDMVGTAQSCELDTADFHIGLDIRTDVGLSGFVAVPNGGQVTSTTIGQHQAKQEADPSSSSCTVAIGLTDSSRVDVTTTGDGTSDPCPGALTIAKLVEPKLP